MIIRPQLKPTLWLGGALSAHLSASPLCAEQDAAVDLKSLREHIRYHLGVLERVLDHFGASRQRRLAFTSHASKARVMDSMAPRIAPRGVKTLVV